MCGDSSGDDDIDLTIGWMILVKSWPGSMGAKRLDKICP
jgi:hypothetical protein